MPRRILVVDDESLSAMVMQMYFEDRGYQVEVAGSAAEAIDKAAAFSPEVLITDHLLGDMTGAELALQLRSTTPDLVAAVVSGLPPDRITQVIGDDPHIQVFIKPVDLDELERALLPQPA